MNLCIAYTDSMGRKLTAVCAWYLTDSAVACIVANGGTIRGVQ